MPRIHALVPALALAAALAHTIPLAAQGSAGDAFPVGRVVERVASRGDPARSYALYLPSAYPAARRWPVMFVMDPRGRALVSLELFREAAERYGWVLMSSYHTLSDADSAVEVNDASLDAMLLDAQQRLAVDTTRLYLAGFSGTARYAWGAAYNLAGHIAGVIGVGGALPSSPDVWRPLLQRVAEPFAFFGAAGYVDVNHDEMALVDTVLAATALPHRFVPFPGGHQWPPKELAAEALEWMQLQAVKIGRAPRDERWIDSLLAARLAKARALDASGDGTGALREYRSVVADFSGLRDVATAQARHAALERDRGVQRELARRGALAERGRAYSQRLGAFVSEARSGPPVVLDRALATLEVERLKREIADTADAETAKAAERMLSLAFSWTASHEPRRYLEARDWPRAAAMLRVADAIRPGDAQVCYSRARALAQTGETGPALDALACAVDSGRLPPATIAGDRLLDPLRAGPRFGPITARARPRGDVARRPAAGSAHTRSV